jgi:hypothetical protein
VGPGVERPQRWEVGRQVRVRELEDAFRPGEIPQPVLAEVAQGRAGRRRVPHQGGRGLGQHHLPTVGGIEKAGDAVQR